MREPSPGAGGTGEGGWTEQDGLRAGGLACTEAVAARRWVAACDGRVPYWTLEDRSPLQALATCLQEPSPRPV